MVNSVKMPPVVPPKPITIMESASQSTGQGVIESPFSADQTFLRLPIIDEVRINASLPHSSERPPLKTPYLVLGDLGDGRIVGVPLTIFKADQGSESTSEVTTFHAMQTTPGANPFQLTSNLGIQSKHPKNIKTDPNPHYRY